MDAESKRLVVVGIGSPSDTKAFDDLRIDGMNFVDYFHSKGIQIYHNQEKNPFLITSVHRTTEEMMLYAKDLQRLRMNGTRVAMMFYGSLALAAPGVLAATAPALPVVAVPGDIDAFYNIYRIPDGTPVGVTGIGQLEKGIRITDKILQLEKPRIVGLTIPYQEIAQHKIKETLDKIELNAEAMGDLEEQEYRLGNYVDILLAETTAVIRHTSDAKSQKKNVGIATIYAQHNTSDAISALSGLENSLAVGRPVNAALLAARIAGLTHDGVAQRLVDYRRKEKEKYPLRDSMMLNTDFK